MDLSLFSSHFGNMNSWMAISCLAWRLFEFSNWTRMLRKSKVSFVLEDGYMAHGALAHHNYSVFSLAGAHSGFAGIFLIERWGQFFMLQKRKR
jgi:hypothetical protein